MAQPARSAPSLAPYDAVLLQSFGGPEAQEEVLPFLRRVTAGRGIPDERLVEVGAHYTLFGGVSPINGLNRQLVDALTQELIRRGIDVPVHLGNRHSTPFVGDVLADLTKGGARRVLAVPTSAWRCYSSCRQYREDLASAVAGTGHSDHAEGAPAELPLDLVIDKVRPYGEHPAVAGTWAQLLTDAVRPLVEAGERLHVLFLTHSIPESMDETSGPGDGEGRAYSHDQAALARALLAHLRDAIPELDGPVAGGLAFCSRSGPPQVPWLEPDVNDRLAELAEEGVTHVVVAPIGFVSDHMEVAYDLDTEAAETAAELGLGYTRVATPQGEPDFVAGLVDLMIERATEARGEEVTPSTWSGWPDAVAHPSVCPRGCCPNLRTAAPTLCGRD